MWIDRSWGGETLERELTVSVNVSMGDVLVASWLGEHGKTSHQEIWCLCTILRKLRDANKIKMN